MICSVIEHGMTSLRSSVRQFENSMTSYRTLCTPFYVLTVQYNKIPTKVV